MMSTLGGQELAADEMDVALQTCPWRISRSDVFGPIVAEGQVHDTDWKALLRDKSIAPPVLAF